MKKEIDINFDVILNGVIKNDEIIGIPNTGISGVLKVLKDKGYKINVFSYFCSEHVNYKKLVKWITSNNLVNLIDHYSIRAGVSEDNIIIDNRSISYKGIPNLYNEVKRLKEVKDGTNNGR